MIVLDIERPKSCNSCPMCFKLGNASICIVGHMPIPLDDSIDENCPIIPEEDTLIPKISKSSATWTEVEFERPLPFGGALTERGYRCSITADSFVIRKEARVSIAKIAAN